MPPRDSLPVNFRISKEANEKLDRLVAVSMPRLNRGSMVEWLIMREPEKE